MDNLGTEKKLKREYNSLRNKLRRGLNIHRVADKILNEIYRGNKDFLADLKKATAFAEKKFSGRLRQDGKTPLFLHSLFLVLILDFFTIDDPGTILAAILHDTIEDTDTTLREIKALKFRSTNKPVYKFVNFLTQDKNISDKTTKTSVISPRVKKFVKILTGAPAEVVNIEIADRTHDLLDLDYMRKLDPAQAQLRLRNKIVRNKNIVRTITHGRIDCNKKMLGFFYSLLKKFR
ncbi:MAG: bifunctional (p)ppGpp synthetase/guanosine-3',5'-bis(diphosphate) 3'-pyrophosphohydrolase [Patescibacteria group bacterium]|nr:HD domain-containing protein [Patescibacteria group bacterium]MDE2015230.1 bifunctional (p)ppGpp synthetase/guanosine-3',5'-bis(diphosphate) 3'-pyrophosphohydrolase [Patescibacteria group bacterium]MDE2227036.1 bifunctional (p)ppGpp synthetase/guanosine-3',5'-bis(diphosphate) 3'-pyrophosphohydrolase [Patescibacteria group bacterium]